MFKKLIIPGKLKKCRRSIKSWHSEMGNLIGGDNFNIFPIDKLLN